MNPEDVSLPLAVFAGLLSFASPCVLPLVPAYLGYLSGQAVTGKSTGFRLDTFWHALAFVLGFSVIFVILGAAIGLVGALLYDNIRIIQIVGGLMIVVFGIHTTGLVRIPFLYQERRLEVRRGGISYVRSFLMGVIFSAGWAPCTGPILGSIVTLALQVPTATKGAVLLAAYSLGLGIPFLVAGLAFNFLSGFLRSVNRHLGLVSKLSGAFLVVVGILIATDSFKQLARYGSFLGGV